MDRKQDKELIDLAVSGETQAFEALANRYYMTVYKYAFRWTTVKEDAEDITQEVFIKLANNLHTFNMRASFSTWLYRITVNCAKDFTRKNRKWREHKPVDSAKGDLVSANPGPEIRSFHKEILNAVNQLPTKLKEATLLVFAEGLTHKEAAQIQGCAETTVSWRIFQAKRKLKKVLS